MRVMLDSVPFCTDTAWIDAGDDPRGAPVVALPCATRVGAIDVVLMPSAPTRNRPDCPRLDLRWAVRKCAWLLTL